MKKIYFLSIACIVLFVSSIIRVSAQLPDPLVFYSFNETSGAIATDDSGNGFDGTVNCDTCWEAAGRQGGAIHFYGSQKIDLPAEDIGLTTDEGTVAFWVLEPKGDSASINCMFWAGNKAGDMFGSENEMHIHSEGYGANVWAGGELSFFMRDSIMGKTWFLYSDPWNEGLGKGTMFYP